MSASTLLVQKWITANCPNLVAVLGVKPHFVVHKVTGSNIPTTRLFMRNASHATWDAHPKFGELISACTPAGRTFFERAISGRTESVFALGDSVVTGPASFGSQLRYNNSVTGGTMVDRLATSLATYSGPKIFNEINGSVLKADLVEGSAFDVGIREYVSSRGFVELSEWKDHTLVGVNDRDTLVAKIGVGRVAFFLNHTGGFPGTVSSYFTARSFDSSFNTLDLESFARKSMTEAKIRYDAVKVGPYLGVSIASLPIASQNLIGFASQLNPARPVPSYVNGYGIQNHAALTDVIQIDDYWLPMIAVPRSQDYFVRSAVTDASIVIEDGGSFNVTTVTFSVVDVLGGIPVAWYRAYIDENLSTAKNKDQLLAAREALAEYEGKTITYCEMSDSVMLPQDLVTLTTIYADYKKAKEKACEENDFMSLEFAPGITYGTVNTTINGSRNTKILFGYRDAEAMPVLENAQSNYVGWTLTGGTEVVTTRRGDGTFAPPYTSATAGEFVTAVKLGAVLSGTTLSGQLAIWGYSASDAELVAEGLAEMSARVGYSSAQGTSLAVYDFRWASLGISGYPDYKSVDQQTQYRMAMLSKALLYATGSSMRELQLQEIQDQYVALLFT